MELNKPALQAATGAFMERLTDKPTTGDLLAALRFALEAYESVRVAPAPASQHGTWISTKDAVPSDCEWVLVSVPDRYPKIIHAQWLAGCRTFEFANDWLDEDDVEHWMPLPPTPDLTSRAQRTTEGK